MTGAGPVAPSIEGLRLLLGAARREASPAAFALELIILTLALPWEAVGMRLECIDWRTDTVPVPARGGAERLLALPHAARKAVLRVAGTAAGVGQVVTAGRGRVLLHRDVRLDRLRERLAGVAPDTLQVAWNFHGIRTAGATALAKSGATPFEIEALLGRETRRGPNAGARRDLAAAAAMAERWNGILLAERGRSAG